MTLLSQSLALHNAVDRRHRVRKRFPVVAERQRPVRVLDALVVVDDVARAAGNPLGREQALHAHRASRMDAASADAHLCAAMHFSALAVVPQCSLRGNFVRHPCMEKYGWDGSYHIWA